MQAIYNFLLVQFQKEILNLKPGNSFWVSSMMLPKLGEALFLFINIHLWKTSVK